MATAKTTGARTTEPKKAGKKSSRAKKSATKKPATGSASQSKKTAGSIGRKRAQKSKPNAGTAALETTAPPQDEAKAYDEQIGDHRRRQASTAAVLTEVFGPFGASNAELWDRRAYLAIVALIYERLTASENDLTTDELVTLSKILSESRRAESQSRKSQAAETNATEKSSPSDKLPENFTETVRQVYGTNFQMPGGGRN